MCGWDNRKYQVSCKTKSLVTKVFADESLQKGMGASRGAFLLLILLSIMYIM